MVLPLSKRVVMSSCAILVCVASSPTHTEDNLISKIATGCAIIAGLGLAGAAIGYAFSRSDEQVAQDAHTNLNTIHAELSKFYMYTQAVPSYTTDLYVIEQDILYPIGVEALRINVSMHDYISFFGDLLAKIRGDLSTISDRMNSLERNDRTYESIYARLRQLRREISEELPILDSYYTFLHAHESFFELYAFEAKLYAYYAQELEIGRLYVNDTYLFERYILQVVGTHDLRSEFPLVKYDKNLSRDISLLSEYISNLSYYYSGRIAAAKQLLDYLKFMRGTLEASYSFKEEKRLQREADERRAHLEYERQQANARQREAVAQEARAAAEWARAREERERNRIERERNTQQPTIVIIEK